MKHGSLFTGIGGFDLAASQLGWTNVFQVEKDKWCTKVLEKHFKNTKRYPDIKTFTAHEYKNKIDIISGGFPCQPFSVAGQRAGKNDDRYLWEEMLRVIATIKPTYVVGENVTGIIGLALDTVLSDLEAQGYTTETFIIPACSKNAWHRRDRVWIIAYSYNNRIRRASRKNETKERQKKVQEWHTVEYTCQPSRIWESSDANAESKLSNERENGNDTGKRDIQSQTGRFCCFYAYPNSMWKLQQKGFEQNKRRRTSNLCENVPYSCIYRISQSGERFESKLPHSHGGSWRIDRNYWEVEPSVGRVANGIPHRVDRLKGLGNAIVPQIAYTIFNAINEIEKNK